MRSAAQAQVTWNVSWPGLVEKLGATLVTYEIEPAGDAVRLTMTEAHERPLGDDILSGGRQGWPAILSSLKSLLETGQALGNQDGAAAADARRAEGDGDQDAVSLSLSCRARTFARTRSPGSCRPSPAHRTRSRQCADVTATSTATGATIWRYRCQVAWPSTGSVTTSPRKYGSAETPAAPR